MGGGRCRAESGRERQFKEDSCVRRDSKEGKGKVEGEEKGEGEGEEKKKRKEKEEAKGREKEGERGRNAFFSSPME